MARTQTQTINTQLKTIDRLSSIVQFPLAFLLCYANYGLNRISISSIWKAAAPERPRATIGLLLGCDQEYWSSPPLLPQCNKNKN